MYAIKLVIRIVFIWKRKRSLALKLSFGFGNQTQDEWHTSAYIMTNLQIFYDYVLLKYGIW